MISTVAPLHSPRKAPIHILPVTRFIFLTQSQKQWADRELLMLCIFWGGGGGNVHKRSQTLMWGQSGVALANQTKKKGQNEKFMNFAHHSGVFPWENKHDSHWTFVPECPWEKFMNWPFFGLVCRGHSWVKAKNLLHWLMRESRDCEKNSLRMFLNSG